MLSPVPSCAVASLLEQLNVDVERFAGPLVALRTVLRDQVAKVDHPDRRLLQVGAQSDCDDLIADPFPLRWQCDVVAYKLMHQFLAHWR